MSDILKAVTRRSLLQSLPSAAALLVPASSFAQQSKPPAHDDLALPVLEQPDLAYIYTGDAEPTRHQLSRTGQSWTAASVKVDFAPEPHQAVISLEAPTTPIQRIHLRWRRPLAEDVLGLGDAWERSYGDLEWRPLQAERALPWYAMLHAHGRTSGMGVKTGAVSFAFWQVDPAGISLWLDVRNGGNGVSLGNRRLSAATIVSVQWDEGETAFAVTQRLCRAMAQGTSITTRRGSMPTDTIFGSNDWYYAYGRNTADGILRDADLIASLAPSGPVRPFTVIDDGYQDPARFPSLAQLASQIRQRNVLPGLWIRPLQAAPSTPANQLLPGARFAAAANQSPALAYDPTIPEALHAVASVAAQACDQGFELIKHDYTTWELFGQWGSEMGASPTLGNWHFNNRSLTNAEVVTALYTQLRATCGPNRVILGCNTVGHLSVGLFDASRTGDDVSGKQWERTRRTGVNTLAFRSPQNKVFFALDADCVPITPDVPWSMTRQWLQAVAASGTVLLVSPDPAAIGDQQKQALKQAFELCLQKPASEPLNWTETRTPSAWRSNDATQNYEWNLEEGATPFPIGVHRGQD